MRRWLTGLVAVALVAGGTGAQTEREKPDLKKERAELERRLAELHREQAELHQRLQDHHADADAAHKALIEHARKQLQDGQPDEAHRAFLRALDAEGRVARDRYRKLAELRMHRGLKELRLDAERENRVRELTKDYFSGWAGLSAEIRRRAQELKGSLDQKGKDEAIRALVDRIYEVDGERNLLESKCRAEIRKLLEPREEARFLLGILDFDMDLRRGLEAFRTDSEKSGSSGQARELMEQLEKLTRHAKDTLESPETKAHLDHLREALHQAMSQAHKIHEEEMVRVKAALEELAKQKEPMMEELDRKKVELRDMMDDLKKRFEEASRAIEKAMKERAREDGDREEQLQMIALARPSASV